MSGFEERRNAQENKFLHDENLRFKAMARRNRMLGRWAAEKLGKTGEDVDAYAAEVVRADFQKAGDEDVFEKVKGDFAAAGVEQSDHQIRRHMDEFLETAIEQVRAEG